MLEYSFLKIISDTETQQQILAMGFNEERMVFVFTDIENSMETENAVETENAMETE